MSRAMMAVVLVMLALAALSLTLIVLAWTVVRERVWQVLLTLLAIGLVVAPVLLFMLFVYALSEPAAP